MICKYEFVPYWSNADDAFVAEVPELPGCMAHGERQQAAIRRVNEAMALWIDTAREVGGSIPEPEGERLMLARRSIVQTGNHRHGASNVTGCRARRHNGYV